MSEQDHQNTQEEEDSEDSSKEPTSKMAGPPKGDQKPNDQEHQEAQEEDSEDSSKEPTSKMASPPKGDQKTNDQEAQEEDTENSSKEPTSKMASPPKGVQKANDQEHQKAEEVEDSEDFSKKPISKMASSPKKDQKTSDQEHQKAQEVEISEDFSTVSAAKLPPSRSDSGSKVTRGSLPRKAEVPPASWKVRPAVPAAPSRKPVPGGVKPKRAQKNFLQRVPVAAPSILIQLPLPRKWSRFFSVQPRRSTHPRVRECQRQEFPTSPPPAARIAMNIVRARHYLYHTTRKPRVLVNPPRQRRVNACPYCGRVLWTHSCFFTRMMSYIKVLEKKLRYYAIRHHFHVLGRNLPNGLCFHNQKKRGSLPGNKAPMKAPLTRPLEQRTNSSRQCQETRNEIRGGRPMYTFEFNSNGSEGPFCCPFCSVACGRLPDFYAHLKTHPNAKVAVLSNESNGFQCPYCGQSFGTLEGVLMHQCPRQ